MRTCRPALTVTALAAAVALLAGCGQEDATNGGGAGSGGGTTVEPTTPDPTTPDPTTPGPAPTDPVPPSQGTAAPTAVPQSVVDESIALLAEQLGVAVDQIEVTNAMEIEWRDGSIGCAEKGTAYTQALVQGVLVELTVDGTTYAFHQGQDQAPFYCAAPTEPLGDS